MLIKGRKFSMPTLRRRAKKMMREKYKKTVKLFVLDKVWSDWVEYAIIRPLIKFGHVEVDSRFSMDIIGKRVENYVRIASLMSKGMAITKTGFKVGAKVLNSNRQGIIYKIILNDKNYKGQLIFEAENALRKRISEHLINSQQVYKICQ